MATSGAARTLSEEAAAGTSEVGANERGKEHAPALLRRTEGTRLVVNADEVDAMARMHVAASARAAGACIVLVFMYFFSTFFSLFLSFSQMVFLLSWQHLQSLTSSSSLGISSLFCRGTQCM
jgi:hypothetical protein